MMQPSPAITQPSDNEYDIPSLRLDRQGDVTYPVTPWGSVSRRAVMPGTWCFYVDDYRFAGVERDALQVPQTACKCAVELNFSLFPQTPFAFAIWATWRKRSIARQWQDAGVGVLVDLCVAPRFHDLNLLGVPKGWRAYATRGYVGREDDLLAECKLADRHSGGNSFVLVYGGREWIRRACRGIPNAVFVDQHMDKRGQNVEG